MPHPTTADRKDRTVKTDVDLASPQDVFDRLCELTALESIRAEKLAALKAEQDAADEESYRLSLIAEKYLAQKPGLAVQSRIYVGRVSLALEWMTTLDDTGTVICRALESYPTLTPLTPAQITAALDDSLPAPTPVQPADMCRGCREEYLSEREAMLNDRAASFHLPLDAPRLIVEDLEPVLVPDGD